MIILEQEIILIIQESLAKDDLSSICRAILENRLAVAVAKHAIAKDRIAAAAGEKRAETFLRKKQMVGSYA